MASLKLIDLDLWIFLNLVEAEGFWIFSISIYFTLMLDIAQILPESNIPAFFKLIGCPILYILISDKLSSFLT